MNPMLSRQRSCTEFTTFRLTNLLVVVIVLVAAPKLFYYCDIDRSISAKCSAVTAATATVSASLAQPGTDLVRKYRHLLTVSHYPITDFFVMDYFYFDYYYFIKK